MKKLLLGLGSIAAIVVPVVSVVSCGSESADINLDFTNVKSVGDITKMLKELEPKFNSMDDKKVDEIKIHLVDGKNVFDETINKDSVKDGMDGFTQKYLTFTETVFKAHGFAVPASFQAFH